MPTYTIQGWVWSGFGSVSLSDLTISDDDPQLSPYFTNDFSEVITINGTSYTNPSAGTYELTYQTPGGTTYTEDFLLFYTGSNFVFGVLPGSTFEDNSSITGLGGWQNYTSGFNYADITCFCTGTMIETSRGPRPVETLAMGSHIRTPQGLRTIRWIGSSTLSNEALEQSPKLRPVRILAGALGDGLPERDLLVSRQHRMLVRSKIAKRMFGKLEVLLPAIKLTDLPGVFVDEEARDIEYYHMLFDQHEIVFAEGAPTESLFTGPQALKTISPEAREEILTLFPNIEKMDHPQRSARFIPPLKGQKELLMRHVKNNKPLLKRAF